MAIEARGSCFLVNSMVIFHNAIRPLIYLDRVIGYAYTAHMFSINMRSIPWGRDSLSLT